MSPDRKSMDDFITVDDSGAFTRQWSGSQFTARMSADTAQRMGGTAQMTWTRH